VSAGARGELRTLEPLLEAVRSGLEDEGWSLSGLQKTTSYEFEGRWAGESSRSAYLFFHAPELPDWISVDVFLDETSRGLKGNLALVLGGSDLTDLGDPASVFRTLGRVAARALPEGYQTPITLRLRLPGPREDPGNAESEFRFKLVLPGAALKAGASAVSALAGSAARSFRAILRDPEMSPYVQEE